MTICPQCEAEIPADAPDGVCPRCLVGIGFGSVRATPSSTGTLSGSPTFLPPKPDELAHHFPELEILELVGCGGMGAVYKARQVRLDRIVALKILPVELGQDPAFAERFTREAQAMAKLSHPNIVIVFDFGEANGMPYLVMEFVDGINLRSAIQAGELQPKQALKIVPQVCEALQYAHDIGIVHRDIKPENILLDSAGRVKIVDFGLAKLLGTDVAKFTLTGSRQMMGTPHYMAPEQMDRPQEVDHRADIYALGVVFYELLTGELPRGRFAPPSKKAAVDARLDEVVNKTLENEPDLRYQQASEVKSDVNAISDDPPRQSSPLTFGLVLRDWWADVRASRKPRAKIGVQFVAVSLFKWLAFVFHVICFYQFVRIYDSGQSTQITRGIGWWVEKSVGERAEFLPPRGIPVPLLLFVPGVVAYYCYWRIRKTQTGSTDRFQYPLRYTFTWLLTLAYGLYVVLDASPAESFIPSSTVLLVAFVLICFFQRIANKMIADWKSRSAT